MIHLDRRWAAFFGALTVAWLCGCTCGSSEGTDKPAPPSAPATPALEAVAPVAPPLGSDGSEVTPGPQPVAATEDEAAALEEHIKNRDPDTLLGGEYGLDHVGVAVSDLERAKAFFVDVLGFSNPQEGKLPNGLQNVNFYFGDSTYLELLTVYDKKLAPREAAFIDKYKNGGLFFVLAVFSAKETAAFLKKQGIQTAPPIPGSIATAGMPKAEGPLWHTMFLQKPKGLTGAMFFIDYDRKIRNRMLHQLENEALKRKAFAHPNKAVGLKSVWLATKDVAAARAELEKLGLTYKRDIFHEILGAQGVELAAGAGTVMLWQPSRSEGAMARFVAERGEGVCGVGIAVRQFLFTRDFVRMKFKAPVPTYKAQWGQALLLSREQTFGAWIELYQP